MTVQNTTATVVENVIGYSDIADMETQVKTIRQLASPLAQRINHPGGVENFEAMARLVERLEREIEAGRAALAEQEERNIVTMIRTTPVS